MSVKNTGIKKAGESLLSGLDLFRTASFSLSFFQLSQSEVYKKSKLDIKSNCLLSYRHQLVHRCFADDENGLYNDRVLPSKGLRENCTGGQADQKDIKTSNAYF